MDNLSCYSELVENARVPSAVELTMRLTFLHRRFAPEWLKFKKRYPELATKEWKHWWAVTEADRYAEFTQPWKAAGPAIPLATLASITGWLAAEVAPFLPSGARRLTRIPGGAFRRPAVN